MALETGDAGMSKLRALLSRRSESPTPETIPQNVDELRRAGKRRQDDRQTVFGILKKLDDTDFKDDDVWMKEFLNMDGNSMTDLADLLVNEKYDAPWILRPDYLETYFDKMGSGNEGKMKLQHHSLGCPHPAADFNGDSAQARDRLKNEDSAVASGPHLSELFLGLAGFIPLLSSQEQDEIVLHEEWRNEMCRHCLFFGKEDATISITYAQHSSFTEADPSSPKPRRDLLNLAARTFTALSQLVRAITELQLCGLICDYLPIIVKAGNGLDDVVEVIDINLSDIDCLFKALGATLGDGEDSIQERRQNSSITGAISWAPTVLAAALTVELIPILAPVAIAAFVVSMRRRGVHDYPPWRPSTQPAYKALSNIVDGIFKNLHLFGALPCTEFFFQSPQAREPPEIETLHCVASCTQILCLGLQSFVQAHTGMPQFSFLDHDLETIYLTGAGLSRHAIVARLQELTCFGKMIKGPILIFEGCNSLHTESPAVKPTSEKPCDLVSSLENVVYIWADARFHYLDSSTDGKRSYISSMWIGGGLLHPGKSASDRWHWTKGNDFLDQTQLAMTAQKPNEIPSRPSARGTEKVRIGAVSINPDCPLRTSYGQKRLQTAIAHVLVPLDTFPSLYTEETRAATIGFSQYVGLNGTVEYKKQPGKTVKQVLFEKDDFYLLPRLGYAWGLRACICTGLIERVTLQQIIAPYIMPRIHSPTYSTQEQQQLQELESVWGIVNAFETADLGEWFRRLPGNLRPTALKIVRKILGDLGNTGVDKEKMLRLAWLQPHSAIECLKIPCEEGNFWAQMFTDSSSENSVAFATITPHCLNTSSDFHDCQRQILDAFDPKQIFRLSTKVLVMSTDYKGTKTEEGFTLSTGKNYLIGAKELMLLATPRNESGVVILNVKPFRHLSTRRFRRFHKIRELKETKDDIAVECIVMTEEQSSPKKPKLNAKEANLLTTRTAQSPSDSSLPVRTSPLVTLKV
ncbi:hypothetical protein BKA65DRAFT_597959 [Rhexocercosporidium sp. MPI-PUGE-AT-0058]|nr:hypothetical protein BKA65DRAFT_597959 [Rhexocercosporidium sp. MPI-PUGE-AT-0058]